MIYEHELEERCEKLERSLAEAEERCHQLESKRVILYTIFHCGYRGRRKEKNWFAHHYSFENAYKHCLMNESYGSAIIRNRFWHIHMTYINNESYEDDWDSNQLIEVDINTDGDLIRYDLYFADDEDMKHIMDVVSRKCAIIREIER